MANDTTLQVRCRTKIGSLSLDLNFTTGSGWTVLFGPSGSGKSSLLRLIAGLWTPVRSKVQLGNEDLTHVPSHLRRVGFVAQQPALFPHRNVLENIRFGSPSTEAADAMLAFFHLQTFRQARIQTLSGGEQQRVALARALAAQPRLLLLDEVFTGMHLRQRDDLLRRVHEHCGAARVPVLSVTHDAVEACLVPGAVLQLEAGRVTAHGPAMQVLAPEREALRQHLRKTSADAW